MKLMFFHDRDKSFKVPWVGDENALATNMKQHEVVHCEGKNVIKR